MSTQWTDAAKPRRSARPVRWGRIATVVVAALTSVGIAGGAADAATHAGAVKSNGISWNTSGISWNGISWNGISWNTSGISWNGISWNGISWNTSGISWNGISWNGISWNTSGISWNARRPLVSVHSSHIVTPHHILVRR